MILNITSELIISPLQYDCMMLISWKVVYTVVPVQCTYQTSPLSTLSRGLFHSSKRIWSTYEQYNYTVKNGLPFPRPQPGCHWLNCKVAWFSTDGSSRTDNLCERPCKTCISWLVRKVDLSQILDLLLPQGYPMDFFSTAERGLDGVSLPFCLCLY
jgi:hypothetical protein